MCSCLAEYAVDDKPLQIKSLLDQLLDNKETNLERQQEAVGAAMQMAHAAALVAAKAATEPEAAKAVEAIFGPEPPATAGASGAWAWVVLVGLALHVWVVGDRLSL